MTPPLLLGLTLQIPAVYADEGMWLPEQVPLHQARLAELGLELPVAALADPMGAPLAAIVSLGHCSASFVSPDGLIATNHHCVAGYLGFNSSAEAPRIRDGYLASDRSQELWAGPAARLQVVESIEDVSARVSARIGRKVSDRDRKAATDRAVKEIVAECEQQADRRCRVASFYGGQSWRLIRAVELKDLRLVYAPPESVGSFGGEQDNWMWPRHAGDFALLRAYVAPDGHAAEHAPANVPFRPAHHLRVDPTGAQQGELVLVAGFPGGTDRHAPAYELAFEAEQVLPAEVARGERFLQVLRVQSALDPEAAARLAPHIDWVGNGLKYDQGLVDGFRSSGLIARLEARDAALRAWVEAEPARRKRHGPALVGLRALHDEARASWEVDALYGRLVRYIDLLSVATTALRLAREAEKPDLERDQGFQDRDRERIQDRFEELQKGMWLPADRDFLAIFLQEHAALPPAQRIAPLEAWLAEQGGEGPALELLFDAPVLAETPARLALLEASAAELAASPDPWVQLAVALEDWKAPRREREKARAGADLRLRPLYMEVLQGAMPGGVYPDANGSLRVGFGRVEGYRPRDGLLALTHTTVRGMAAKAGAWPFDAPERVRAAARSSRQSPWADPELGDVPVAFLTDLDTTGGSSGSATLNGKGELVGLLFDGNYESMSSDYLFDPALTRSIHVDIRYLLWMLDEVERARWILDELGLSR